jgi:rhodanese-related sulfurtransferase
MMVGVVCGLVACGGGSSAEVPAAVTAAPVTAPGRPAEYGLVTPQQAALLAGDGLAVIDVRTPEEFAEGHIEGATMIDFYSSTFSDDIAALDPSAEYLVYCRSGNRSGQAVSLMRSLGITQVYDLDGGVIAYGAAGLPLVP